MASLVQAVRVCAPEHIVSPVRVGFGVDMHGVGQNFGHMGNGHKFAKSMSAISPPTQAMQTLTIWAVATKITTSLEERFLNGFAR